AVTPKYWRTYGIHVIEGVCAVMGLGIESVQNVGADGEEIVHMRYADGRHAVLQTFKGIKEGFHWSFYGDEASAVVAKLGAYSSFRNTLLQFVEMLKTGKPTIDWHETVELTKVVIAGRISLAEGNRVVRLEEIKID
ncbi:unnamed protein product, partial [marine sediment metagenome]